MRKLPMLTCDLIRQLDEEEGPLNVKVSSTMAEIQRNAGRRELIDSLVAMLNREQPHHKVLT